MSYFWIKVAGFRSFLLDASLPAFLSSDGSLVAGFSSTSPLGAPLTPLTAMNSATEEEEEEEEQGARYTLRIATCSEIKLNIYLLIK